MWMRSHKEGSPADFSGASLNGAELYRAKLNQTSLQGAHFRDSELGLAQFDGAKIAGADFTGADLARASLVGADLSRVLLDRTELNGAKLDGAVMIRASLIDAHLMNARLTRAQLQGAVLTRSDLSGADLSGADLVRTALDGTYFNGANLHGVHYEPERNPAAVNIALAKELGYITWDSNPEPIYELRKSLLEAGEIEAARQVNAAIRRHGQNWLVKVLFDWTCEWGSNWLRPLKLVVFLLIICTPFYWVGMHLRGKNGLYLVSTGQRITTSKGREHTFRMTLDMELSMPSKDSFVNMRHRLQLEFTALGTAFLFSLMSVFNIGFREFNFGRWIRMLQPREFDIRARGWVRTLSGIQSLAGVVLVALALLSYFGQPFY